MTARVRHGEGRDLKDFETLVRKKAIEISNLWTAVYVRKEHITAKKITRRLPKQ